jgi:uncharacterized protein DUF7008
LPLQLPTALVKYSTVKQADSPVANLARWITNNAHELRDCLDSARDLCASYRRKLIAWQEELDWQLHEAFGLLEPTDGVSLTEDTAVETGPEIEFGQRAFEFVLARRLVAGEDQTTWFERHGATPQAELPAAWAPEYRGPFPFKASDLAVEKARATLLENTIAFSSLNPDPIRHLHDAWSKATNHKR